MPTFIQESYITKVQSYLDFQDPTGDITISLVISALTTAVDWYSKDRPLQSIHVITGDGTNRYVLPSTWDSNFSRIVYVEFPAGANATQDPSLLQPEEVAIWEDNVGERFHFRFRDLTTSDTAWIKYTRKHILTSTTNTIPDTDREAVCFLAAAVAALEASGRLIKHRTESGIGGIPDLRTTSDVYKSYAQEMLKNYYRRMGIDPNKGQAPVLELFDVDVTSSWGFDWLTHQGR